MATTTYQWLTVQDPFFVNTDSTNETGNQTLAAITRTNGGSSYFTTWFDGSGGVGGRGVENDGDFLTADDYVNGTTLGVQTDPSVAQLISTSIFFTAPPSIIVTYTDYSVDAGGDVRARFVSAGPGLSGGTAYGTPGAEIVIDETTNDTSDSDVAALTGGGFIVSWTRDFGGGDTDVHARIFNANGTVRSDVLLVDNSGATAASASQVAGLVNGNSVIVYQREAVGGGDSEVVFTVVDSNGVTVVAPTVIDTFGSHNEDIQVVALADGGFAVAYADNGWSTFPLSLGAGIDISFAIFEANGASRSGIQLVNTGVSGDQLHPTLTTLSNGYVVVGWNNGGSLNYQAYTPAGAAVGTNEFIQSSVVEAEIAGLSGGLIGQVRESSIAEPSGTGTSIRSEINELVRTIIGDGTGELLSGDSLRDFINGGAGNDTITGGASLDTLTGGPGADNFRDSRSGLNGDTITDFEFGDNIIFTDANPDSFTYSLSGSTLTYTGGSLTLSAPVGGTFVASAAGGGGVQLTLVRQFDSAFLGIQGFGSGGSAGSWTSNDAFPRMAADVNGDGRADIIGFGNAGAYVSLANADGTFGPSVLATSEFGAAPGSGGWASNNQFPRVMADINGDTRADIVAFGNAGVYVALGQTNGTFAASTFVLGEFGSGASAGGWASNDIFTRLLGDVNGDGRADIVGFGDAGVYVALGQASGGFGASTFVRPEFGYGAAAGGWASQNIYPRLLGDVNGDTRADIVAFGESGVYVALGQTNGTFAASTLAISEYGHGPGAGGWSSQNVFPRRIADINGDNRDDIVGFGNAGVYFSLGNGDGTFQPGRLDLTQFGASGAAGGWSDNENYPRVVADVDGDGSADIIGFGTGGAYVSLSIGDYF